MTSFQSFLADEHGSATIEFLYVFPLVMTIFMASFESSMYMVRSVMLERSVDLIVRDIRLGLLEESPPAEIKRLICEAGVLAYSYQSCIDSMKIWMQPINTADFSMIAPPRYCIDKGEDIATENENEDLADVWDVGADDEIMLMRICLKEAPMFPTTRIAGRLVADGENDGNYALFVTSVYVNEPG